MTFGRSAREGERL